MVLLGEENDQSFAINELDERVYRHYGSPQLEWLFLGWWCLLSRFIDENVTDDAKKFTSKMHDPCARSRYLQKRTKQEHHTEGTGVEPAEHPPKVKSEIFLQL